MHGAPLQPDARQRIGSRAPRIGATGEFERQHHVLNRGERGNQVEGLEHETDALRPQACAAVLVKLREILAIEQHTPAAGHVETCEQRQQRRLARPRRAAHRHGFPGEDLEGNVIDNSQ